MSLYFLDTAFLRTKLWVFLWFHSSVILFYVFIVYLCLCQGHKIVLLSFCEDTLKFLEWHLSMQYGVVLKFYSMTYKPKHFPLWLQIASMLFLRKTLITPTKWQLWQKSIYSIYVVFFSECVWLCLFQSYSVLNSLAFTMSSLDLQVMSIHSIFKIPSNFAYIIIRHIVRVSI